MSIEETNVQNIYSIIATDFSRTRQKVWKSVDDFVNSYDSNTSFLEIGCGNGKNMLLRPSHFIGCDTCKEFVSLCKGRGLNVVQACATKLPFNDSSFDATLSVAVIHHLSTDIRRESAIKEQIRVTRPGGKVFIEVWGLENNNKATDGANSMVPWKYNGNVYERYYHFFEKSELIGYIKNMKNVTIETIYSEKYNWVIILNKLQHYQ